MPASSFNRLFGDADGPLGSKFLDSTAPTPSASSVHHLVVTLGLIETSQTKTAYGHWRTKTQCKSDSTLRYWKSPADLPAYLSYKVKELNPTTMTTLQDRLDAFRTEPIGCIILVTQYINSATSNAPNPPVIMLIAAPSMATLGPITQEDPPGLLYEDLWDAEVLAPFETHINIEEPHCPVLGASEGFSRAIPSATPKLYLEDAKPLFFPAGELLCGTVPTSPTETTYRCIFSPRNLLSSSRAYLALRHRL
jgi:hypothetical protein